MKKTKEWFWIIYNAFQLWYWAIKNPLTVNPANFKMLSDLLVMILSVKDNGRALMTNIAIVHPEGEHEEIVSIWAGAGVGASPAKRITELNKEYSLLKLELSQMRKVTPPSP